MLKDFKVESTSKNLNDPMEITQKEFSVFLDSLVLVILNAFMVRDKILVRVIFNHLTKKIVIESRKDEGRIIVS